MTTAFESAATGIGIESAAGNGSPVAVASCDSFLFFRARVGGARNTKTARVVRASAYDGARARRRERESQRTNAREHSPPLYDGAYSARRERERMQVAAGTAVRTRRADWTGGSSEFVQHERTSTAKEASSFVRAAAALRDSRTRTIDRRTSVRCTGAAL